MSAEDTTVTLHPIGVVKSPRAEKTDDNWGGVEAEIVLDEGRFAPASLTGLDSFSHLEVVFYMHRVDPASIEREARHPRNNPDWPKVGIFTQRAKGRPNRIGVSRCAIRAVDGTSVTVTGLDAINGTPVLDLKPYFREFGPRGPVEQPDWVASLMSKYHE